MSEDGKQWFHFAGPRCVSNLTKYRATKRQSKAYGSGLRPTAIRTAVAVPLSTPTARPVFSGGDMLPARVKFRTIAARTYSGRVPSSVLLISGIMDSMETLVPGSRSIPAPSSLFGSPQSTSPGKLWGDFTLFHPASPKTLSISLSNPTHSVSWQTLVNMYSVPAKGLRAAITCGECGNDLGVVRRSNWAVSALARFIASARCDSASAACFFANAMSRSKESASCLAPVASSKALDAEAVALSDWPLARAAAHAATSADALAFPAALLVSASKILLNAWTLSSACDTTTVVIHSPATPTTINNQPRNAASFTQSGACSSFSDALNLVTSYLRRIALISWTNSGPSQIRPATTILVDRTSQPNQISRQANRSALILSSMYFASSGDGSIRMP